jgi:uncharacterized DUF497 family protein
MLFVRRLVWDSQNIEHIARHKVTPDEVERVCYGRPMISETYGGRIRVVGLTGEGRILTIILAPTREPSVYYPVTARPADRRERKNYQKQYPKT